MSASYYFGEVPGNPVGTPYVNRAAAKDARVHQVTQQGISGNRDVGANSIIVNGGYEDDLDFGDEIIYTGAGGNDPATKRQIANQELTQIGNAALVISEENAYPVRVLRGSRGEPAHSPATGLRYDGLFRVVEHWSEIGLSGFRIWRFKLVRLGSDEAVPFIPTINLPAGNTHPTRTEGVVQRIVRSTQVADTVKRLYGYACQICGLKLSLPVGHYAEGAHIRGLGTPHHGPDTLDNILCLCPNHHVLLDKGAIYLDDTLCAWEHAGRRIGSITQDPHHSIDLAHVQYHRATLGI